MNEIDKKFVLASSSEARKSLLKRLNITFTCQAPNIDESAKTDEPPEELAQRLALEKALAVCADAPQHYIIASDQVASCDHKKLNKPYNVEKAIEQLKFQSGKTSTFYTSICLYDSSKQTYQLAYAVNEVKFRALTSDEIHDYVLADTPLHCAGSFKAESLGIKLFEYIRGDDPNALVGLPLILLSQFLRNI